MTMNGDRNYQQRLMTEARRERQLAGETNALVNWIQGAAAQAATNGHEFTAHQIDVLREFVVKLRGNACGRLERAQNADDSIAHTAVARHNSKLAAPLHLDVTPAERRPDVRSVEDATRGPVSFFDPGLMRAAQAELDTDPVFTG